MLLPMGGWMNQLGYLLFGWILGRQARRQAERKRESLRLQGLQLNDEQERRLEAQAQAIHRKLYAMQKKDPSSVPEDLVNVDRDTLIILGSYYLGDNDSRISLESLDPGNPT